MTRLSNPNAGPVAAAVLHDTVHEETVMKQVRVGLSLADTQEGPQSGFLLKTTRGGAELLLKSLPLRRPGSLMMISFDCSCRNKNGVSLPSSSSSQKVDPGVSDSVQYCSRLFE